MPSRPRTSWRENYLRRRARNPGSVELLKCKLWFSINMVETQMKEATENGDVDVALRASHSLNLLAGTYWRAVAGDEQTRRIDALEQQVQQNQGAAKVSAREYIGGLSRGGNRQRPGSD